MKKNIVIVPFHDYKKWIREGFRTRDSHIYSHMKNHKDIGKILIINRPVSLIEVLLKRKSWKTFKEGNIMISKNVCLHKIDNNVYCVDFFLNEILSVIAYQKSWWHYAFCNKRIIEAINNIIKQLKLEDSILLLQNPMSIEVAKKIHFKKIIFDAIDNWLEHPQMKKWNKIITKNYQYIDKTANQIIIVSKKLKKIFPKNKNVIHISNGVDKEYFANCIKKTEPSFNIGYIGKIQERVDFNLIEECLIEYPNYQFYFAGPVYAQKRTVKKLNKKYKNIHFLGDIHYNNLPEFLQTIDIALIPHKINEFTNSMNPLKIYEYLAAGKPIISTNIEGIKDVSDYIFISKDNISFKENIKKVHDLVLSKEYDSKKVQDSLDEEFYWTNKINDFLKIF